MYNGQYVVNSETYINRVLELTKYFGAFDRQPLWTVSVCFVVNLNYDGKILFFIS
jgi:hypothetical protein